MSLKSFVRRALYALVYSRGDAYHCALCGISSARFLSYGSRRAPLRRLDVVGAGRRRNSRCPNCLSKDRERLLFLYLRERSRVFTESTWLLHVAPEPRLAAELARASTVRYVCGGLDTSWYAALGPLQFDVRALPFGDARFDVVLCNHVLEYVPEDATALAEIRRVLVTGGFAILQVPLALGLETTFEAPGGPLDARASRRLYGHANNVRVYGRDYGERLRRAGFAVARHNPFREGWVPDVGRHGLDPRVDLYVATKSEGSPRGRLAHGVEYRRDSLA